MLSQMHVLSSGHSYGQRSAVLKYMPVGKRMRALSTSGLARGLYAVVSAKEGWLLVCYKPLANFFRVILHLAPRARAAS